MKAGIGRPLRHIGRIAMGVMAIGASDSPAGLPKALRMLKSGNLARDQKIAGDRICVIDVAKAGVALGADRHRFRAHECCQPNGLDTASRHGGNVSGCGSVATFAANTAMRACA